MQKCVVIINPSSGKVRFKEFLPELTNMLNQKYEDNKIVYTEKKGDAINLGRTTDADTVIVVGGDGTIREVVNGLMQNKRLPKLGIIPSGTVNDFARALRIPLDPFEAITVLKKGTIKYIDVGKVNETYFISLVAIGGIPQAIHNVRAESKTKWGIGAYFFNGAKYAIKQKSFAYEMVRGNQTVTGDSSLIVLSLLNSVAGMRRFFQHSKPNDGIFHVMVFPQFKFVRAGYFVAKILAGKIHEDKAITLHSGNEIRLTFAETHNINIDGEKEQGKDLHLQVIPKALPVYCE